MSENPHSGQSFGSQLRQDVQTTAVLVASACVAFVLWEFVAMLVTFPEAIGVSAWFGLFALTLALTSVYAIGAGAILLVCIVALRSLMRGPTRLAWLHPNREPVPWTTPRQWLPHLWAIAFATGTFIAISTILGIYFTKKYNEPQLRALLLSVVQLGLLVLCAIVYLSMLRACRWLSNRLADTPWNAAGTPTAAAVASLAGLWLVSFALGLAMPQSKNLIPWRDILGVIVCIAGAWTGWELLLRRRRIFPVQISWRRAAQIAVFGAVPVLIVFTFTHLGAPAEVRGPVIASSPTLNRAMNWVRTMTDFDGDGQGFLLGEGDCAPFDAKIHRGAPEILGNGIDENCDGIDAKQLAPSSWRVDDTRPVPPGWLRDWNILLITMDTVRADHTTLGGYHKTSGRDTTPFLAELGKSSTVFTFANATSAGTMASVPALLTSKYFHSGIALDETKKPPKLLPSNTTIPEVLKARGYRTGAVLSHYYFRNWGMQQGVDSYDNDIGKDKKPARITSAQVTDKAIAFVSKNASKKWFLWAHYLDPHHPWQPHSDSFGDDEVARYDTEIKFTDSQIRRLIENIRRFPGANKTIIIVTSDHGEEFGDHGGKAHGNSLYAEVLRVPFLIYVPDLPPRQVTGPVSILDIFPTIADLVNADVSDLRLEGESLVPQLFYGDNADKRYVFAENNAGRIERAVINKDYKLIFNLTNNIYKLFDLQKDPIEKRNIVRSNKKATAAMKLQLSRWLERTFYSRDTKTNQAAENWRDTLVDANYKPKHAITGLHFDNGSIEVIGCEVAASPPGPGDTLAIALYFRTHKTPSGPFKLQLETWLEATPVKTARSKLRFTTGNRTGQRTRPIFPTSRWRSGEVIRDRFKIKIPRSWHKRGRLAIGLRLVKENSGKVPHSGAQSHPSKPNLAVFAHLPFAGKTNE